MSAGPARRASRQARPGTAIAWLPTLLAKGPHPLAREHLRRQPARAAVPTLHLIVLDTSASMLRGGRLALAKGHAAWLIEQAGRAGDDAGMLSFGGHGVELVLPPGPARAAGAVRARMCGGGGGTPLAEALALAGRMLERARGRGAAATVLWLLTDGRTLERPQAPVGAGRIVIVDFERHERPIGRCAAWARAWDADYRRADQPAAPR